MASWNADRKLDKMDPIRFPILQSPAFKQMQVCKEGWRIVASYPDINNLGTPGFIIEIFAKWLFGTKLACIT